MTSRHFAVCLLATAALCGGSLAHAQRVQHTRVQEFQDTQDTVIPNPASIRGSFALLVRKTNAISTRIRTRDLPPGAYTAWWEIYNSPENCVGECDFFEDAFNPATRFSVFWAAGGIVGADGRAYFEAELNVGELPGDPCPAVPFVDDKMLFGCGLLNPAGAQIAFIIKTHGEPNANQEVLARQVGSIGGACVNTPGPVDHPEDPDPAFRIFSCYDPQIAIFHAPR